MLDANGRIICPSCSTPMYLRRGDTDDKRAVLFYACEHCKAEERLEYLQPHLPSR